MQNAARLPTEHPGTVEEEIALAISRIRYGSVVVHIQDGAVVQIESTEKRRFPPGFGKPASAHGPRTA